MIGNHSITLCKQCSTCIIYDTVLLKDYSQSLLCIGKNCAQILYFTHVHEWKTKRGEKNSWDIRSVTLQILRIITLIGTFPTFDASSAYFSTHIIGSPLIKICYFNVMMFSETHQITSETMGFSAKHIKDET